MQERKMDHSGLLVEIINLTSDSNGELIIDDNEISTVKSFENVTWDHAARADNPGH